MERTFPRLRVCEFQKPSSKRRALALAVARERRIVGPQHLRLQAVFQHRREETRGVPEPRDLRRDSPEQLTAVTVTARVTARSHSREPLDEVIHGDVGRGAAQNPRAARHFSRDVLDDDGGLSRAGRPVYQREIHRSQRVRDRVLLRRVQARVEEPRETVVRGVAFREARRGFAEHDVDDAAVGSAATGAAPARGAAAAARGASQPLERRAQALVRRLVGEFLEAHRLRAIRYKKKFTSPVTTDEKRLYTVKRAWSTPSESGASSTATSIAVSFTLYTTPAAIGSPPPTPLLGRTHTTSCGVNLCGGSGGAAAVGRLDDSGSFHTSECRGGRGVGGERRREEKSLRIGVHHANAVVWQPVYRTHLKRQHRLPEEPASRVHDLQPEERPPALRRGRGGHLAQRALALLHLRVALERHERLRLGEPRVELDVRRRRRRRRRRATGRRRRRRRARGRSRGEVTAREGVRDLQVRRQDAAQRGVVVVVVVRRRRRRDEVGGVHDHVDRARAQRDASRRVLARAAMRDPARFRERVKARALARRQRGGKPHGHRARGVEDLATRRVVVVAVAVAVVVVVAVVRARGGGRLRRRLRRALRRPLLLRELHPARRERGWTRRDAGEGAREI
eukprot:30717-Pelagococcus_subviridis.AAC.13